MGNDSEFEARINTMKIMIIVENEEYGEGRGELRVN